MTTIKLAILWLQIYSIRLTIHGCDECLECVSDPKTINRIHDARLTAKRELHRLRGEQRDLRLRDAWRLA